MNRKRKGKKMTNAQIIFNASMELVEQGKLAMVDDMPEPIHTFQAWKALGYCVKKGEKSEIKITIWKHKSKVEKNEETNEEIQKSSMFMKTASFFRFDQVEKMAPIKQ